MNTLVSIILPAKNPPDEVIQRVAQLKNHLESRFGTAWEIILSLNGDYEYCAAIDAQIKKLFAADAGRVKSLIIIGVAGKGLGVRAAYEYCNGAYIGFMDWDLPYRLDFIDQALVHLEKGSDFVTANRRIPESRFDICQERLGRSYMRHCVGTFFNFIIRQIFSIKTRDTQAGAKLMRRNVADIFFSHMTNMGFLFDIELFLIAKAYNFRHVELPVSLIVNFEKSTIHFVADSFRTLKAMSNIKLNSWQGQYSPLIDKQHLLSENFAFSADDWGLSPSINDGIINLAKKKVVRRISMMTNVDYLSYRLDELLQIPDIEFGLHFNLTHGYPLSKGASHLTDQKGKFFDLKRQIIKSFFSLSRNKMAEDVRREFKAQLKALAATGVKISFVDGHHHIHTLPRYGKVLLEEFQLAQIRFTRIVSDSRLIFSTTFLIYFWSLLFRRRLKHTPIKNLPCIYPKLSRTSMKSLAGRVGDQRTEIICHPAVQGDLHMINHPDSYNFERVGEYWFLMRAGFQRDLQGDPSQN